MMVTDTVIPMGTTLVWIIVIALLGVLFAFPLKRRFINDEQHPFPEGRAAGIVMDALHTSEAREGMFKAKVLVIAGALSALLKLMQSHAILAQFKAAFLTIPEYLDAWIYKLGAYWHLGAPKLGGVELRELTVRPDTDFVMMAAGGLMGIRVGVSLLIGAVINYLILAPWAISVGDIPGQLGDDGVLHYGFRRITAWALWGGVAMMTTASLLAFFAKPQILLSSFRGLFRKGRAANNDVLRDIELPMKVFVIGIPVVGAIVVLLAHYFFGVKLWLGAIAVPLVFVF